MTTATRSAATKMRSTRGSFGLALALVASPFALFAVGADPQAAPKTRPPKKKRQIARRRATGANRPSIIPPVPEAQPLLDVKGLVTTFQTSEGELRAVDGATFDVPSLLDHEYDAAEDRCRHNGWQRQLAVLPLERAWLVENARLFDASRG